MPRGREEWDVKLSFVVLLAKYILEFQTDWAWDTWIAHFRRGRLPTTSALVGGTIVGGVAGVLYVWQR